LKKRLIHLTQVEWQGGTGRRQGLPHTTPARPEIPGWWVSPITLAPGRDRRTRDSIDGAPRGRAGVGDRSGRRPRHQRGAPHRRHSRPAHPPVPDHRDQGRELSAVGRQIQDCPGHGPEGSNRLERDCHHACGRGANHQVASNHRATVFDRCALLNWTGVHRDASA
jgi:hypothetical protein